MLGKKKVLIVDDDAEIVSLLSLYLRGQGFDVAEAMSLSDFRAALPSSRPDIVILDITLPDGSGLEACRILRDDGVDTPIILLTAMTDDTDRIVGLEFGADDYLGKPFNPQELVARIRAVLRRTGPQATREEGGDEAAYVFEGFLCDPAQRAVRSPEGEEVRLTGAEFDLLRVFLDRPQRLISREALLDLTNKSRDSFDTTINVLISRIRKKFQEAGGGAEMIRTIRGGGYQLTAKVSRR